MTDFSLRCWKNGWLEAVLRRGLGACILAIACVCNAQSQTEVSQVRAERIDDEILVSAQIEFDLSAAVEDALLKGIPVFFAAEASLLRERWYWSDKKIAIVERHFRLAYQPLTRLWRLNVSGGNASAASQGLTLNQSFDTLQQALGSIKRISRWKLADATDLDSAQKYKTDFRFRLDLTQLPRPFQIGAIGQADWEISFASTQALSLEPVK
jgi:hypothetical protein